jgi:hypothetical protein
MLRVRERGREIGRERICEWETRRGRREIRPLRGPVLGGWCWVAVGRAKADDWWNPGAPTVKPRPATRQTRETRETSDLVPV